MLQVDFTYRSVEDLSIYYMFAQLSKEPSHKS